MEQRYKDVSVTNFTNKGKCSCCGNCCGDILHLSKKEIEIIDKYLKKHKIEPTPRIIMVNYDNTCPFRDNEKKICKIYEVRPEICRVYKCDKSAKEVYEKKELTNKNKLPRSMRNIFFNDNKGAKWIKNITGIPIYDRKNKIIESEEDGNNI